MNEKTLARYLKVKALAEHGVDGEKATAKRTLKKLQSRYPGIEKEAQELEARRAAARTANKPNPSPSARRGAGPFAGRAGNWEHIFRQAAGFYASVMDVVEEVADAYYGRVLAEDEVELSGRKVKDNLYIRVKIPLSTVSEVRTLNGAQKAAFRETIQEGVETYLDAVLEE